MIHIKILYLLQKDIHILIHAKNPDVISKYVESLKISENGMKKTQQAASVSRIRRNQMTRINMIKTQIHRTIS